MKCERCPNENAEVAILDEHDDDGNLVGSRALVLCPDCIAPLVMVLTEEAV